MSALEVKVIESHARTFAREVIRECDNQIVLTSFLVEAIRNLEQTPEGRKRMLAALKREGYDVKSSVPKRSKDRGVSCIRV